MFLLPIIFISMLQPLFAAEIDLYVDRDPITMDESFTLTFESRGDIDDDPNFAPLKRDFTILSTSQSSSYQIINGRSRSTKSWVLNLMANKVGKLTIPPIAFGTDSSPLLMIEVKKGGAQKGGRDNEDLFLRVESDKQQVYQQAQLIFSVRLYRAVNVLSAAMTEPEITTGSAVIEKLGEDTQYETRVGPRRFLVTERRYAIFPQQAGTLTIEPIRFEGQISSSRMLGLQLFNQGSRVKRVYSEPLTVEVLPRPESMQGKTWLPADSLELQEEWSDSPQSLQIGEPMTRTITIQARGLTAAQLPEIGEIHIPDLKQYPDQPQLEDKSDSRGIYATRTEKLAIIPTQAGELVIPGIEIHWWDINEHRVKVSRLPARSFTVEGEPEPTPIPTPKVNQPSQPIQESALDRVVPPDSNTLIPARGEARDWYWISVALASGWFLTLILWLWQVRLGRRSTSKKSLPVTHSQRPDRGKIEKELFAGCRNGDAKQCEGLLLEWAQAVWENDAPVSLLALQREVSAGFAQQIDFLLQSRYGGLKGEWNGGELIKVVKQFKKENSKGSPVDEKILLPLNPA